MTAYYNEIDPYAAQWIRNLIEAGHIAPGVVDERSIEDVKPDELVGYTQCHFFAGIGVWSLALRLAGWPDNRPVWTGSCPCQPFSAAGAGAGFADERHLWPAFHHLIAQCKPPVVIGEQVASKAVEPWVDLVHADLEALGYAFGAVPFPSAGVGAPHIRDRLYWAGDSGRAGLEERERVGGISGWQGRAVQGQAAIGAGVCGAIGMADTNGSAGDQGRTDLRGRLDRGDAQSRPGSGGSGLLVGLADADSNGRIAGSASAATAGHRDTARTEGRNDRHGSAGPGNSFWSVADWLFCRDGKWRPVEPGSFPLAARTADGVVRVRADQGHRAGRLKGYGNAINAQAAQVFIESFMGAEVANG